MKITPIISLISLALVLALASPAFCSEAFQGTIQGADCVINKLNCAKDLNDPHLAMERDFVLVTEDGTYFFMPNLRRSYKQSAYRQQVRVQGGKKGNAIFVERFEVLKDRKFICAWDRARERRHFYRGGK